MSDSIGSGGGWRSQLHLGVAIATVLAGTVVFASGAARVGADVLRSAGFSSGVAAELAALGAAALPLVIVGAVLVSVDATRRYRHMAVLSGTVAIAGIAVATTSATPLSEPVVVGLYGVGTVLLSLSLVGGVVDASRSASRRRPSVEYVHRQSTDRVMPSDGGEEDDDLQFPLDDEE